MITLTTATGKTFMCDFASAAGEYAIFSFPKMTIAEVMGIFSNPDELPIKGFETYKTIANVVNEPSCVKLILK